MTFDWIIRHSDSTRLSKSNSLHFFPKPRTYRRPDNTFRDTGTGKPVTVPVFRDVRQRHYKYRFVLPCLCAAKTLQNVQRSVIRKRLRTTGLQTSPRLVPAAAVARRRAPPKPKPPPSTRVLSILNSYIARALARARTRNEARAHAHTPSSYREPDAAAGRASEQNNKNNNRRRATASGIVSEQRATCTADNAISPRVRRPAKKNTARRGRIPGPPQLFCAFALVTSNPRPHREVMSPRNP